MQLILNNHFLKTKAWKARLIVWKTWEGGNTFFTFLALSLIYFQPLFFFNSWKVWDTLLELIRVEWGKRWGETAEITSLLSLPPCPHSPSLCPHVLWLRVRDEGAGRELTEKGVQLIWRGVSITLKSRGWWNESLLRWSENVKKLMLQEVVINVISFCQLWL